MLASSGFSFFRERRFFAFTEASSTTCPFCILCVFFFFYCISSLLHFSDLANAPPSRLFRRMDDLEVAGLDFMFLEFLRVLEFLKNLHFETTFSTFCGKPLNRQITKNLTSTFHVVLLPFFFFTLRHKTVKKKNVRRLLTLNSTSCTQAARRLTA